MDFQAVDYSKIYYQVQDDAELPDKRQGKFVVISRDGERFAVFSPKELHTYHAHIAQRFLEERGVDGHFDEERGNFVFSSPSWKIEGGGKWRLDAESETVNIFGESMAYGRVDLRQLADQLTDSGFFEPNEIIVGASPL